MVANLKRYDLQECNFWCCASMEEDESGEWVKFKEAMEASSNSLQKLKAEIAQVKSDLVEELGQHVFDRCFDHIVAKLEQLSAA